MRFFTISTILVFCCLCLTQEAKACFCQGRPLSGYITQADLVFVGEVINIRKVSDGEEITFKVTNLLKELFLDVENPTDEIIIFQTYRIACLFEFKVGKKYTVFSNSFSGKDFRTRRFSTDACAGNKVYSQQFFKQIKKELDKLKKSKVSSQVYGNQSNRL
jgi:hypothetical protein